MSCPMCNDPSCNCILNPTLLLDDWNVGDKVLCIAGDDRGLIAGVVYEIKYKLGVVIDIVVDGKQIAAYYGRFIKYRKPWHHDLNANAVIEMERNQQQFVDRRLKAE